MYLSQTMTTLVLLLFLTGTLLYQTIDIQKDQVLNEMKASSVNLKSSTVENAVETSLPAIFNKVLNDAEFEAINKYNSGKTNPFNSTDEVLLFLETNVESTMVDSYLKNVSKEYNESGYNLTYDFNITNISMVDGFTFKIGYSFNYTLSKDGVFKSKSINSYQYCTVKTVIDAYHYVLLSGRSLSDWKYRIPIIIHENSGEDLMDYQVLIKLNSTNFDFSKANPDGSDIRFTYLNSTTNTEENISYWIEYWNSTSKNASIWIKTPYIPADGSAIVYMYYGNPNAASKSNGDATFVFFDDFEGNDLNWSKWIEQPANNDHINLSVSNGVLFIKGYASVSLTYGERIFSKNKINLRDMVIEGAAKRNGSDGTSTKDDLDPLVGILASNGDVYLSYSRGNEEGYGFWLGDNQFEQYDTIVWRDTSHHKGTKGNTYLKNDYFQFFKIERYGSTVKGYLNGDIREENIGNIVENGGYLMIYVESRQQGMYVDFIRVRKYANPEPTVEILQENQKILIYISPPRDYGTHYGEIGNISYNPYFVEDNNSPSIIDMLAGHNTKNWTEGYGIKLVG